MNSVAPGDMGSSVLLTGADGFTGAHFTLAAHERGHDVYPLQSNLLDPDAITGELAGRTFDYVVHLAAISAVTHADELALYQVNLFGTLNLLEAIASLPHVPSKVLVASSANIYGNTTQSPIDEAAPPAPVNHYAMSKLAMEYMLARYQARLPIVVARPFNYTGPGQDSRFVIPKLVRHFSARKGRIELGNVSVEREFNDVRLVCEAYLGLLERGERGEVYNICSGTAYSLTQVIGILSALTGHQLQIDVNPEFVRSNEVHRLCGDPAKLQSCLGNGAVRWRLEDTLQWMLESAPPQPTRR